MSSSTLSNRKRARLIVGIDYGTTYSGISFAMSTAENFEHIFPWTAYPGSSSHRSGHCEKAPSLVAFASENEELEEDAWGYEVEPGMKTYAWTKLLLDKSALPAAYDDPDLKNTIRGGRMKLPKGRTAKEIVTAYLRGMNRMYQGAVAEKLGEDYMESLPVDFWLTVPATWSDEAKQLTMDAALDAGFGARSGDRVRLIPEPEAAAHLALKMSVHHVQDLVEAGSSAMVCDLGGGTVDITSYEVQAISPSLKLRELCVGGGGKCGGTFVDRNFHKLMEKRFGACFTSLEPQMIGPGSQFMDQFEMAKRDFSMKQPKRRPHRLLLPMDSMQLTDELKKHYQKPYYVLLTHHDLNTVFEPVGDMVIGLVSEQVKRAKTETDKNIDHMVLVGGFGSSPYIKERLQDWCRARKIRLTTPWSGAWSAVVRGAVLRGIEGGIATEKRCRRHYGYDISEEYDSETHEGYDRSKRHVWKDYFYDTWMLSGFVKWSIAKNAVLRSDSNISNNFWFQFSVPLREYYIQELYSCGSDEAPETLEEERVEQIGKIHYTLDTLDLSKLEQTKKDNGSIVYQADLTMNIRMGDEDGLLVFEILHEGVECGKAKLNFLYL